MTAFIKHIETYQYSGLYENTFLTRFFKCDVDLTSGYTFRSAISAQTAFINHVNAKGLTNILYTDGSVSCNNFTSGADYAIINQHMECLSAQRINNYCNIFHAEASGILHALNIISTLLITI